jgi:aryl-alcohol dehydrogenase-like predicted oxidoreductase
MKYRSLGRTGWRLSEIGFGAWAIGGAWGKVDDEESMVALHAALDGGVNFFDAADGYSDGHSDGRSERLLARLKKERKEDFYIATKAGRRLPVQTHPRRAEYLGARKSKSMLSASPLLPWSLVVDH